MTSAVTAWGQAEAMRAIAAGPLSPSGHRTLKLPCGHTGAEADLAGRVRERVNALWVRCPRCNVIALVVGGPPRAPRDGVISRA